MKMNVFTATVFDTQENRRKIVSSPSSDFKYLKKQINKHLREDKGRYTNPKIKLDNYLEKSELICNLVE